MKGKGWHDDSVRHSLAARGIETSKNLLTIRFGEKDIGHIEFEDFGRSAEGFKQVFIIGMEIEPALRGRGIGKRALKQAEEQWKGEGYRIIRLDDRIALSLAVEGQSVSESFWRKQGYRGRGTEVMKYIGG